MLKVLSIKESPRFPKTADLMSDEINVDLSKIKPVSLTIDKVVQ